ncbi:MAG: carbon storage regulator [Gammaproteobacteria bacterium]|nr:carbon storage regulator [Gammaproteobacteria bacterium]
MLTPGAYRVRPPPRHSPGPGRNLSASGLVPLLLQARLGVTAPRDVPVHREEVACRHA